jgi:hypothetical protein
MNNIQKMPLFSFVTNAFHHKHYKCIVANDDVIDRIDYLDEFYKAFGYTIELAKAGVGADEFIWDNYINDSRFHACMQMHVVQYLNKHSENFKKLYGEQYEEYVKEHVVAREARGYDCYACKHKEFCKDKC